MCGTTWTGILRGNEQDINLAFNGLYNHRATEGELEFLNMEKTVAKFWTTKERMEKYFKDSFYFRFFQQIAFEVQRQKVRIQKIS
jgi:hypothetical protein